LRRHEVDAVLLAAQQHDVGIVVAPTVFDVFVVFVVVLVYGVVVLGLEEELAGVAGAIFGHTIERIVEVLVALESLLRVLALPDDVASVDASDIYGVRSNPLVLVLRQLAQLQDRLAE
jgi:hypothetical protein